MAHSLYPLVSFNAGEWSPAMDSRIDLPNYRKACRQLRNMIPLKQGGATRRPGTEYVADGNAAADGGSLAVSRLAKFQYAPGTTFILEFGDRGVRFFSNGQQEQASPVPAWASGANYPAGSFVANGAAPNVFYLYNGPLLGSTTAPGSDPTHWRHQFAYEVPVPYKATISPTDYWGAEVFKLQMLQVNDVVYIVHPDYPVHKITRFSDTNWVSQEVQFLVPPLLDENFTDTTIAASATTGTGITLTATAPAWAAATSYQPGNSVLQGGVIYNCQLAHTSTASFTADFAAGDWSAVVIFQAGHVNSYWQLAYNRTASFIEVDATGTGPYTLPAGNSSPLALIGTWSVKTYGTWSADIAIQASYDGGKTYQVISILTSRSDFNADETGSESVQALYRLNISNTVAAASTTVPRVVLSADNQFVYGLVQITAVADDYHATATVITPLYATTATTFWSEGAWSDVRGYPRAITVFQERVWYAGTTFQPQRIWATQTDDIENFARYDQSQATYGLAFDLNAPGRGPIQWLAAQTDLFAGLAGAEWIISAGPVGTAITATQILAQEHSVNGSAPYLPAEIIGNACFYVQRKGQTFQQMLFSVFTNKYMSQDMQLLAQHLPAAGLKQFDYQQQFQNQSILWAVCGDGSLISLTYAMDQDVFGWAKHTTGEGTDPGFISVQVIYGANGRDDEVWVSTIRGTNRFCTIERIHPIDWQTFNAGQPQLNKAVYSDCSITRPTQGGFPGSFPSYLFGRTACAMIVPLSGAGAWSAEGLTIESSGTNKGWVTIPNYVAAPGDTVIAGLSVNWKVQPMRLDIDPLAGAKPAVKKAIQKLYPRMLNSIGGNWATKEGDIIPLPNYPITQNSGMPPPFTPNVPLEVELDVGGLMQYADDPVFLIQGTAPLPFTLLGITIKYDLGGST